MTDHPGSGSSAPGDDQAALRELYRISADPDAGFEEKTRSMLELGCSYLDLPIGFVSSVDPDEDRFEVVEARGSHELIQPGARSPLSETYCRKTIEEDDGLLTVHDAAEAGWEGDPAYEKFDLGCYLGGKLTVDEDLYGTLCFAGDAGRETSFSSAERTFVELTAQWLSYELEHREYERELREERDFVQQVIDTLDDGVFVIDPDGAFVRWNDNLIEAFGYDDDEIEEMSALDFFVPEDRERVAEAMGEVLDTGTATLEATVRTADGRRVPYEFRARRLTDRDGDALLCGVARDVSERAAREEELAQYETIVETMDDAAWIVGRDGRLRFVNERVTEILDVPEERVVGRELDDLLDDDLVEGEALPAYVERLEGVLAGESEGFRMDLPLEFGWDRGVLDVRVVPLTVGGSIEGAVGVARDVTRQRQREERLAQYERAMESVEGMVYVLDASDRFSIVTPGFADRLGYDREELRGEHVSLVLNEESVRTRADHIADIRDADRETVSYQAVAIDADGERFPVRIDASLMPGEDGFQGTAAAVTDLSELEAARRELHDERDRFEFLFENVPDPVLEARFVDGEPIIEAVNAAFEDTFGYDETDAAGRSVNDLLVPPDDRDAALDLDECALAGEDTSAEVRRETVEGLRDFLFRGIIFESEGETRGFGIYTDITDQKRRERHLTVLSRVLRHNLRNDLNLVIGQAGLIADRTDAPDLAASARTIGETASDLVELSTEAREIEHVLDPGGVTREPIDVRAVLEGIVDEYRERYPAATIEFETADVPRVEADVRLSTAFEELVENAVEHAGDAPRVEVSVDTNDGWIDVSIGDDGPGIPEVERGVVTGETEITQIAHGSGLGLWVVKWIVESYGGELLFDVDDGTTVTLLLRPAGESST